jgi:hypothetical protein
MQIAATCANRLLHSGLLGVHEDSQEPAVKPPSKQQQPLLGQHHSNPADCAGTAISDSRTELHSS